VHWEKEVVKVQIDNLFLLFAGMAIVTYIPRVLPFILFREVDFSSFTGDVLKNLRYAILGGLILPGVFLVNDDPSFGIVGGTIAFLLAYTKLDVVYVVIGTIGVMSIYTLLT